ncbi:hypothetical protein LTR85_004402 [Meristemomyces frigidus]|nr:hypothetical protein LTR85_004402 [Meristemomyces frigidus]
MPSTHPSDPAFFSATDELSLQPNYKLLAVIELRHAIDAFEQAGQEDAAAQLFEHVEHLTRGQPQDYYDAQSAAAGFQHVSTDAIVLTRKAEVAVEGALKLLQQNTPLDEEGGWMYIRSLQHAYNAYMGVKTGAPKTEELGYHL